MHTYHAFVPEIAQKFSCGKLVGRPVNGSICITALVYFELCLRRSEIRLRTNTKTELLHSPVSSRKSSEISIIITIYRQGDEKL